MEIYNGGAGFDSSDRMALEHWESGLAEGKKWIAVGASDSHHWETEAPGNLLHTPIGWPHISVGRQPGQGLLDAIRNGQTVITEPGLTLRIVASSPNQIIGPGQAITGLRDYCECNSKINKNTADFLLQIKRAERTWLRKPSCLTRLNSSSTIPPRGLLCAIWPSMKPSHRFNGASPSQVLFF